MSEKSARERCRIPQLILPWNVLWKKRFYEYTPSQFSYQLELWFSFLIKCISSSLMIKLLCLLSVTSNSALFHGWWSTYYNSYGNGNTNQQPGWWLGVPSGPATNRDSPWLGSFWNCDERSCARYQRVTRASYCSCQDG